MAEVMPINFPLPSENAVASYNYTDMAEGTGVTVFYLVGATGDNILTTQTVYADDIENATAETELTSDYVKLMDTDYDLSPFNNGSLRNCTKYAASFSVCFDKVILYLLFWNQLKAVDSGFFAENE